MLTPPDHPVLTLGMSEDIPLSSRYAVEGNVRCCDSQQSDVNRKEKEREIKMCRLVSDYSVDWDCGG
jgi:hypothetical protein